MLPLHSDEELDDIGARLAESGALALLLVEVEPLGRIEWRYGTRAYETALHRLLAIVREITHDALPEKDVFITIEQGGDAILAFLFRPRSDRAFFTAGLRELRDRLTLDLFHQGKHAVYPYHREPLSLGLGGAIALYNPNVKPARQILKAVEIARRDALLEAGLRARERGAEILELILRENLITRYEPIVEIATRRPIGYEALTRGPEDSPLHTPERLFGQAKEVGLLFELDCLCRRLAFESASCIPRGTEALLELSPRRDRRPEPAGRGPARQPREVPARARGPRDRDLRARVHRELRNLPRAARYLPRARRADRRRRRRCRLREPRRPSWRSRPTT